MDVVTAVSGSGPAYFFLLAEAVQQAAEQHGLAPATARLLSEQTALGAARMLTESQVPATELRHRVTSPGGTTEAALAALFGGGLPDLVGRAIDAAVERGRSLSRDSDDDQC